jgi:hypothetical protein
MDIFLFGILEQFVPTLTAKSTLEEQLPLARSKIGKEVLDKRSILTIESVKVRLLDSNRVVIRTVNTNAVDLVGLSKHMSFHPNNLL